MAMRVAQEERWCKFFTHPSSWWDNRGKKWPKYPDFKHVSTGEGLWIASCPERLRAKLILLAENTSDKGCRARYRDARLKFGSKGAISLIESENKEIKPVNPISTDRGILATAPLTVSTLLAALKKSAVSKDLDIGIKHHNLAIESGYNTNIYVATALVSMYAKCGKMEDALKVFRCTASPDVGLWNALILGYARNGEEDKVMEMFSRLKTVGRPNARTFTGVLMACSRLAFKEEATPIEGKLIKAKSLERAVELHKLAEEEHCVDPYTQSTLVELYAKCGSMVHARLIFDGMPNSARNVVVWNNLISGYVENDESQLALELFSIMGCSPDARTFVAAFKACARLAVIEQPKLLSNGRLVRPDSLQRGLRIHAQAAQVLCVASDVYLGSTLINMYAKCGSMVEARKVFDGLKYLDVVAWNSLMLGYVENEDSPEALRLFARLNSSGDADATSYTAAVMACGKLMALDQGMKLHAEIESKKLERHAWLATALVDFYGKCGIMTAAEDVFKSLGVDRCGIPGWNALAAGYSQQGDAASLLQVVQRMQDADVKPDGITYILILTACSHAGLVNEGRRQFQGLLQSKAVSPTLQHYTCMIDILGRAGRFDEIQSLVNDIPFKADVVLWRTLLGACRKWKNVEVAGLAFESLVKLDPKHATAYVLMGEIYGSLGMLEDRKKVIERKKTAGAHKQWGKSWWSDQTGVVHSFVVGDTKHAQSKEINVKVKDLMIKLERQGYNAPATEEEDLCGHSEKLALACALLNTRDGETIRITKNLRVCDDCHKVTTMLSRVERRVIICRDASRLHVFKDGRCSCQDY